jgi:hypothetical protein
MLELGDSCHPAQLSSASRATAHAVCLVNLGLFGGGPFAELGKLIDPLRPGVASKYDPKRCILGLCNPADLNALAVPLNAINAGGNGAAACVSGACVCVECHASAAITRVRAKTTKPQRNSRCM